MPGWAEVHTWRVVRQPLAADVGSKRPGFPARNFRMWSKMWSRLTYANVVATLALFLALGGGAYAAARLPPNSVGAQQIKPNAVDSGKVRNRSLLPRDFKAGQLPVGPPGARGAQGEAGPR